MRLRVIHEGGLEETITLVPSVEGVLGKTLNHLSCGDGTDFFFTQEGFYDGWGRRLNGVTEQEADQEIERMQDAREIEENPQP